MKKSKINPITDISKCFSLEENELEIIRILGRYGTLNKNKIESHSSLTRRKIGYSIDKKLMINDFIKIHSKKPYRNIRTAFIKTNEESTSHGHKGGKKIIETTYTLTQKGWLASINLNKFEQNFYLNYHIERCPENKKQLLMDHVKNSLEQLALNLNLFNIKLDSIENLEWILEGILAWDYALMSDKHETLVTELRNKREKIEEKIKYDDNFMKENFSPLIDKIMLIKDLSSLKKLPLTQKRTVNDADAKVTRQLTKKEYDKRYFKEKQFGIKSVEIDHNDVYEK